MERYIMQLIEDLREASWNLNSPHEIWEKSGADTEDELEMEDMSYVEKFIYGDEIPISEITGIMHELLPPPEELTQEQRALLSTELEKLLLNFHFILEFPVGYPAELRYPFIRNFWLENHVSMSIGNTHIEFCEYNEEECPFQGYCDTCREVAMRMDFDIPTNTTTGFDIDFDTILPN
ncbi:MAG: hypothetical protein IPH84_17610 [Bacteroidales bacterium]|nr:hypothetical protein [Bacteroidales bacterium]